MAKYIVDGENEFETAEEAADYIIENMDNSNYDEMLDECYEDVDICGYSYPASLALSRVDEVAYRCGRNDYYDSLRPDMVDELEGMDDGESTDIYGYEIEFKSEEAEEE